MLRGLNNLSFSPPSLQDMRDTLRAQGVAFHAGWSEHGPPAPSVIQKEGFIEDFDAYKVGHGRRTYRAATEALSKWEHLQLDWVTCNRPPSKIGSKLSIAAHMLFVWLRNPLSIVYRAEMKSTVPFFLGSHCKTLPKERCRGQRLSIGATCLNGHVLSGEERWAVQWQKCDDSVWYEVYAYSKPDSLLAWVAYPLCRYYQQKFRRDSASKMIEVLR